MFKQLLLQLLETILLTVVITITVYSCYVHQQIITEIRIGKHYKFTDTIVIKDTIIVIADTVINKPNIQDTNSNH